jgi:nicotinate-nucleotide pyrophosphorylase (carboxylating)
MVITPAIDQLIDLALEEDAGRGDVTSDAVFGEHEPKVAGRVMAKEPLVMAGGPVARAVFGRLGIEVDVGIADGLKVAAMTEVMRVSGEARRVLMAERTALNFLQRMSGIATLTRRFVEAIAGTSARVCDTRKTAPGWRALDKWAVRAGGGANHRGDLASGILIKDNHVAAAGGVAVAVERARSRAPHPLKVEVEITTMAELDEALAAGADVILLDNMSLEAVQEAVGRIAGRAVVEVSGGVTLETIRGFAAAGVDRISVGALTHSARAVDLSLEL